MTTPKKYSDKITNGFHYINEKNKLIIFDKKGYINVILGYPIWRAYYKSIKNQVWMRYRPDIDLFRENLIHIPSRPIVYKDSYSRICNGRLKRPIEKQLRIPFKENYPAIKSEECLNQFFRTIPIEIKNLCAQFSFRQWALVASCLANKNFIELLKINPVLAFMLANLWVFNKKVISGRQHSFVKNKLKLKQKEILKYTGFPETNNINKIFSKINTGNVSVINLLGIREILTNRIYSRRATKVLSHLKSIDKNTYKIISTPILFNTVSDKFICEIQENKTLNNSEDVLTYLFGVICKSRNLDLVIPNISSYQNLMRTYIDLTNKEIELTERIPPPPFRDTEHIKALKTKEKIIEWGVSQKNCIKDYLNEVAFGGKYFYSVFYKNETATFEIITRNGKRSVGQILGPENKNCSIEILRLVNDYMKEQGMV